MNKAQFIEVLSGFIAPRLVDALTEQADNKGYFEEKPSSKLDVTSNDRSFEDLRKGISDTMEKYKPRVTVPTEVILDNGKTFQ